MVPPWPRARYCCVPVRVIAMVKVSPWHSFAAPELIETTSAMERDTGVVVLAGTVISEPLGRVCSVVGTETLPAAEEHGPVASSMVMAPRVYLSKETA